MPRHRCLIVTFVLSLGLATPASWASTNFEIIVNANLWAGGQITHSINRYMMDLHAQGYTPILTTQHFSNPEQLRNHLADRYTQDGLAGAFLIGNLPVQRFDRPTDGSFGADYFPIDLYYQDLNGVWEDTTGNGRLDRHSGHIRPEIFLGRLTAHTHVNLHPGRTEASLINEYFDRNHLYRSEMLGSSLNSLSYIDNDWTSWANSWGNAVGAATAGEVIRVTGSDATANDYRHHLSTFDYEHVLVAAHSNATRHTFASAGSVHNHQLAGLEAGSLFYNLFACSGARYNSNNNLGGEYLFGGNALIAVGTTKTGGMLDFNDYYQPLGNGQTFGEAMQNWWNQRMRNLSSPSNYVMNWFYGMTLMGDPLLLNQSYLDLIPVFGDLDRNGIVDDMDLALLQSNLGLAGVGWNDGDVTGDGRVTLYDAYMLFRNYEPSLAMTTPPSAIPEPAAWLGIMLGSILLVGRR